MKKTLKVALIYDFDYTLSPAFMQDFMMEDLGIDKNEFWKMCNAYGLQNNMDSILAYLYKMIEVCKNNGVKLTEKYLNNIGKSVVVYKGVEDWFARITKFGKSLNLDVEHYIISSGNKEILDGTKISKYFKRIYASSYVFDENGEAYWPKQVVNYTTKTQYLFRIKKNILDNLNESNSINKKMDAYINYDQILYFGDGFTDIPIMKVVKDKGGYSICVYEEENENALNTAKQIRKDKRVNYIAPTDYSEGSKIDSLVKDILRQIQIKNRLKKY